MKTIEKVFDVLEVFLKKHNDIGIVELANLSNLNISTTHRIASTLVKRGYLNQHRRRGKYALGPKLFEFGSIIKKRMKIGDVAFPFLDRLNRVVDESVNLAILDRSEAVYIEHVESSHVLLRIFTQVGNRVPLHCTGVGKVFLAHMREPEVERCMTNHGLVRCTQNTITDFNKLKKELAIVRRDGVATDDEETEVGVRCIAAPVRNGDGSVVASISISGPSARLNDKRVQELKPLVKNCALDISRAMGFGS